MKGLKRTKAKIEVIRKVSGYVILKDKKEVKTVRFKQYLTSSTVNKVEGVNSVYFKNLKEII